MFVSISEILLLQVFDFTTIDLTSENDEIPDIIALEEENRSNHSHALALSPHGKMVNN